MKIEVDTINDSIDELKKTINLIEDAIERRTGISNTEGVRINLKPSEYKRSGPKIIFEDILSTAEPKKTQVTFKESEASHKRKILKQDEHIKKEEEEDDDRKLPQIQYRDFW